MPIHDWTRVDVGVFHHFHLSWIVEIKRALNTGVLPREYYALIERATQDLAPLVISRKRSADRSSSTEPEPSGGIAVTDDPPRVRFHVRAEIDLYAAKTNRIGIRHQSRHQLIAMIEIVSPGNKDRRIPFAAFIHRAEQALRSGIHLLIVDLCPPTPLDPDGIHRAIWEGGSGGILALPADKPLTCVSYLGYPGVEAYLEPVAVGDSLPDMPLFLTPLVYIPIPLEATYLAAWEGVPDFLQETLAPPSKSG